MPVDISPAVIAAIVLAVLALVGVIVVSVLVRVNVLGSTSGDQNQLGNTFQSVIAATTDAIDVGGVIGDVDGIRVFSGERILVRKQRREEENGLYVIGDDLRLSRAPDLEDTEQVIEGNTVYVIRGDTQQGATYVLQRPRNLRESPELLNQMTAQPSFTIPPDQAVAVGNPITVSRSLNEDPLEMTFEIVADVYLGNASGNSVLVKDPTQPTSTSFTDSLALEQVITGSLTVSDQIFPNADGTFEQVLSTGGTGELFWRTIGNGTGNVSGQQPAVANQLPTYADGTGSLLTPSTATLTPGGELTVPGLLTVGAVNSGAGAGVVLEPFSTASGSTRELRFRELTINGVEFVSLRAPDSVGTSTVFTLPDADGAAGDLLRTDGGGNLSFTPATLGGNVSGETPSSAMGIPVYKDASGLLLVQGGGSLSASGRLQANDYFEAGIVDSGSAVGLQLNPYGLASGATRELRFQELTTSGTNYVGFKAPDVVGGDVVWTLPDADGAAGQGLTTDGTGTLAFSTLANVSGQTPAATGNLATYVDTTGSLIRAAGASCTVAGELTCVNTFVAGTGGDGTVTAGTTNQGVAAGVVLQPFSTFMGSTKELQFKELTTNGSNHVGFKGPDLVVADLVWTLPAVNGNVGDTLQVASGTTLSWKAPEAYRILEQQPAGTDSTSAVLPLATWNTRVLNTLVNDSAFSNVTLVANQFTIPVGSWDVSISSQAINTGLSKCRLRNLTDGTTDLVGSSMQSTEVAVPGAEQSVVSRARRLLVLTAPKLYELQFTNSINNVGGSSMGVATNQGEPELYAEIVLMRHG